MLSNSANNQKDKLKIGEQSFEFVYEALDVEALIQVFKQISIIIEHFNTPEKVIQLLELQLLRENNDYTTQIKYYNDIYQEKLNCLKETFKDL